MLSDIVIEDPDLEIAVCEKLFAIFQRLRPKGYLTQNVLDFEAKIYEEVKEELDWEDFIADTLMEYAVVKEIPTMVVFQQYWDILVENFRGANDLIADVEKSVCEVIGELKN